MATIFCSHCCSALGETDFECPRYGNCVIPQATKAQVTESVRAEWTGRRSPLYWGLAIGAFLGIPIPAGVSYLLRHIFNGSRTDSGFGVALVIIGAPVVGATIAFAIGFIRRRRRERDYWRPSTNE
ncbi:MAG TPA: hypothetical protein VKS79_22715 [Gemmataceae bacterium]|nr:hypothetical protein [Gemmataceae bacterium]